jgi:hypothetical protein
MRRRKLLVALAGLAVVVAVGVVVLWPREDRVTRENRDRLKKGTTKAEVETILGPPGDYRTGRGEEDWGEGTSRRIPDPGGVPWGWIKSPDLDMGRSQTGEQAHWVSDSVRIWVVMDDTGRVRDTAVYNRRLTQGPLDNLVWRAKRQWHRWFPE